ncbi:Annexin A10, partial [Eschrichtius robustus]|nr:Annexin A10 [Eschrichtius robustus]
MVTGQPWGDRGTLGTPAWGRGATWRPVMFQVLWETCQQRTGEHKTLLQMILCNKSYQQLWLVLCVRDKPAYFAYRLYSAIHDFGFHNKTVIRILIARSEIDLMTIRKRYKERYGKSLFHDIKEGAASQIPSHGCKILHIAIP